MMFILKTDRNGKQWERSKVLQLETTNFLLSFCEPKMYLSQTECNAGDRIRETAAFVNHGSVQKLPEHGGSWK